MNCAIRNNRNSARINMVNVTLSSRENQEDTIPKQNKKIDAYLRSEEDESFPAVLARLIALDGLSFSTLVNSKELRKSLEARNFHVPNSQNTIRSFVLQYSDQIREKFRVDLLNLKKNKQKFSISFDEWTSTRNKRYINIIIHSAQRLWNTDLVRIKESLTAVNCIKIVEEQLSKYNLSLSEDIVAVVTDGASTMVKVGRLITAHHRLCLAHGIQLGIIDVLYKKKENADDIIWNNDDDEIDSENSAELDFLHECLDEDYLELNAHRNLSLIINKVRNIVRQFRKSPQKNEVIQNYSKMEIDKELNLNKMLQRFHLLEGPIKRAAIDLRTPSLGKNELKFINTVVKILEPVELAVRNSCRQVMNLCTADAAIVFMLKEIDDMISPLVFA